MLGWAVFFLVIALIAAVLGFGGIAGTAVGIAKLLFFIFLAIFAISLIMGLARGRTRVRCALAGIPAPGARGDTGPTICRVGPPRGPQGNIYV